MVWFDQLPYLHFSYSFLIPEVDDVSDQKSLFPFILTSFI